MALTSKHEKAIELLADPEVILTREEVAKAATFLLSEKGNTVNNEASHGKIFRLDELRSTIITETDSTTMD